MEAPSRRRKVSLILLSSGALLLLAAVLYAGYAAVNTWLRGQGRYLETRGVAQMPFPTPPSTAILPTREITPTVRPGAAATTSPPPTPTPALSPPVQIRIPAIGVSRSIIELPATQDPKTGAWTRDTDVLFRAGRSDLVGHWEGSAHPGQAGNMILVGHNYGHGYNGVFVRLGRLKAGAKVTVVDEAGQSFVYQVIHVERIEWKEKDLDELVQHWNYLSPGGDERLTLVTCGGANVEPFPERVYVVAEPAR